MRRRLLPQLLIVFARPCCTSSSPPVVMLARCWLRAGAMHSPAESSGRQDPGAALMAKLGAIADGNERRALLRDNFQACDDPAMQFLAAKLQAGAEGHWEALITDLQALMTERLEAGKGLLTDLLASGEINVLDRKIVEKVKSGECDPSFLNVLQINLQDAERNQDQEDGSQVGSSYLLSLLLGNECLPMPI